MQVDLIIRGGTVVTSAARFIANIGIRGEQIVAIGGDLESDTVIDARGLHVLPGGIDAHVHLTTDEEAADGVAWADDFTSGSEAAFAGGITTLGNMTFARANEPLIDALDREAALVERDAMADVILHPVIHTPSQEIIDGIADLPTYGHTDIKFFMSTPRFDAEASGFLAATRAAGKQEMLTMIHCEDWPLLHEATQRLIDSGRGSLRYYADARPIISEVVATQRAVAMAEATGAPVYIVHLSSRRALEVCREARSRGVPVYVETRPFYLHLTRERFDEPDGAKYVGQPPLREQDDVDALWDGLAQGAIDTVCTDHAPWKLEHKLDPALTVARLRPGAENLQTMLPMLYSEGVRTGRISLERMVAVTATNAARLFGLYPRKGTIAPGSDADLVLWDLDAEREVRNEDMRSRAGHSVYNGWPIVGWPVTTIRRGEVVYDRGTLHATPGSGRLLSRSLMEHL